MQEHQVDLGQDPQHVVLGVRELLSHGGGEGPHCLAVGVVGGERGLCWM
ncbi:hypothetical protein SNL152K_1225 [Streptomyces sp. NL15-2K]|nr:hypothetical protein SNL152K_1225 [Streptomyces sp. NL15-2K]